MGDNRESLVKKDTSRIEKSKALTTVLAIVFPCDYKCAFLGEEINVTKWNLTILNGFCYIQ